ncbi:hypothetical protein HanIR_Chr12g0606271 [Helianthus annuus]|nr:hypothetical protein HanIR_Chr12g0606271 [Helianthus annuus]
MIFKNLRPRLKNYTCEELKVKFDLISETFTNFQENTKSQDSYQDRYTRSTHFYTRQEIQPIQKTDDITSHTQDKNNTTIRHSQTKSQNNIILQPKTPHKR